MRKLLLTSALLLSCLGVAHSATVEVTWEWPTERVDGKPLDPATELKNITIEHGACNASNTGLSTVDGQLVAAFPQTVGTFDKPAGDWCLSAYVVDTDSLSSDRLTIAFTVPAAPPETNAKPSMPVIVKVAIVWPTTPPPPVKSWETYSAQGYQSTTVNQIVDGVKVKAPGSNTVKVGVPCDCSKYGLVDGSGVQWCSVGGQLQAAWNTTVGGIPRGEPFPDNYVATCREVQP